MKDKAWTFRRRLVTSWVGTTLLSGGYIGLALEPYNRLYMFFDGWDTFALIFWVAGWGLLMAILLQTTAALSSGRSDRWLSPWFYFWIVLVGFNFRPALRLSLVDTFPWLSGTVYYLLIWGVGLLLTVAGYRTAWMRRASSAGWRGMAYLWPLLPILIFNLFTAQRWIDTTGVPSNLGVRTEGKGPPVVLILLDMIGYEDVFTTGGQIKKELPHLAAFAETASIYHQARSCGDFTVPSVPGLLLQEEVSALRLGSGLTLWASADRPALEDRPSQAFTRALPFAFKQAGYRSLMIGFYLPYKELIPGAFDEVFTRSFYGVARAGLAQTKLGNALCHQAICLVSESKDPLSGLAKQLQIPIRVFKGYIRELTGAVHAEGLGFIRNALSPGDFIVIHLPVPHQPYVFDPEGRPSPYAYLDPAGYPGQLQYADRLFGELTDALRQARWWERSWVLFCSDHGPHFRDYSGTADGKRHVPLMVKAPGQVERLDDLKTPLRLADLEAIPGFPLPSQTAAQAAPGARKIEN